MSDVSVLSNASLGRLLTPAGQSGATGGDVVSAQQRTETAEQRTQAALTTGTDSGSTPTGGRGQFVDVYA